MRSKATNSSSGGQTESAASSSGSRGFWQVAAWLTAYKLAYLAMLIIAVWILPDQYNLHIYNADFHYFPNVPRFLLRFFVTWDAEHYLAIAKDGYRANGENSSFYPLWPFAIRLGSYLFGSIAASAIALANIFSVLSISGLYVYIQKKFGMDIADRSIILLLALPGSIFFSFPYAESLCLGLVVLTLYYLDDNKLILSGVAAALGALCRPIGLLIALVYVFAALDRKSWRLLLMAAFPVAGFAAFFLVLYLQTGNPFGEFASIGQFNTGSHYANGYDPRTVLNIAQFVRSVGEVDPMHDYGHSPIDRLFFLWFLATLPKVWKLDKTLFGYALGTGLIPAIITLFMSYTRYVAMSFPMLIVAAQYFKADSRRAPGFIILVAVLFMLQMVFLILHANNNWAG